MTLVLCPCKAIHQLLPVPLSLLHVSGFKRPDPPTGEARSSMLLGSLASSGWQLDSVGQLSDGGQGLFVSRQQG